MTARYALIGLGLLCLQPHAVGATDTPFDPTLLTGTWYCSTELTTDQHTWIATSVDQYASDGTAKSHSQVLLQLPEIGLDASYEIQGESRWQFTPPNLITETILALPKFEASNPELEKILQLKDSLLDGKPQAAKIVALNAQHASFEMEGSDQRIQRVDCHR